MTYIRLAACVVVLFSSLNSNAALCSDDNTAKGTVNLDGFTLQRQALQHRFHEDSVHHFNFRYAGQKRGIKPFIAPALLITGGTAIHYIPESKKYVREIIRDNMAMDTGFDDYLQYAPAASVYLLNLVGIKGKNNFGNRSAIAAKSILISSLITLQLKNSINTVRPNGEAQSFPSGHTSTAFTFAQFMHREYGDRSIWYSIGAYSAAGVVAINRLTNDHHWLSDVLAGAGIGMLATELVYLTHQYKWDNEHIRRLDIFPFRRDRQNGLSLVYTF